MKKVEDEGSHHLGKSCSLDKPYVLFVRILCLFVISVIFNIVLGQDLAFDCSHSWPLLTLLVLLIPLP